MTLTIEFTAPKFSILPWVDILWQRDKAIGFGWGPLQVFITNFSPIAAGNYWRYICGSIVKDDDIMNQLDNITTDNNTTVQSLNEQVNKIMSR